MIVFIGVADFQVRKQGPADISLGNIVLSSYCQMVGVVEPLSLGV